MQLTQSFTVLYGAVAVALSLTGAHALPTIPWDSGLSFAREFGQNGTHQGVPVIDITRRATPPLTVDLVMQSIQVSGQDVGFMTTVKLGDQGQVVPVRVDTGSSTLWVVSATSQQRGRRAGFQSAHPIQRQWNIGYADGSTASGSVIGQDDVQIGSLNLPSFPVGLGETLGGNLINDPDSGILGLANGRLVGTQTGAPVVLEALKNAKLIPASVVGIKLGRPSAGRLSIGKLTLGGANPTQFNGQPGNFARVPNASNAGLWIVPLTDVRVGGTAVARGGSATLDTGAGRIQGSLADVTNLHAIIPGAGQHDGIFAIPCNTNKIVTFTVNRIAFPMAAADIIGPPIPTIANICLSNVQASTRLRQGQWSLGIPFLRNVYQILDSEHNQIILAKLA